MLVSLVYPPVRPAWKKMARFAYLVNQNIFFRKINNTYVFHVYTLAKLVMIIMVNIVIHALIIIST